MRVFGGHDYYDSIMGVVGVTSDDPTKFVRTNKTISTQDVRAHNYGRTKLEWMPFDTWIATHFRNFNYLKLRSIKPMHYVEVHAFQVYFCGKVYLGYRTLVTGEEPHISYSYSSLVKYLRKFVTNNFPDTPEFWASREWGNKPLPVDQVVLNFSPRTREYFLKHKLVCATNYPNDSQTQVVLNGYNLGQFKFQQVVDPFTAYQTIEAWISNDLACQIDGPDIIDDKIKIQKHGFDLKTSFRHPVKV